MIELYVSGGVSGDTGGYRGTAWYAYTVFNLDTDVQEGGGTEEDSTANRGEIIAAVKGLRLLPEESKPVVYSHSSYLVNTCNKGWKRNVNNDLWPEFFAEVERTKATVLWKTRPLWPRAARLANRGKRYLKNK